MELFALRFIVLRQSSSSRSPVTLVVPVGDGGELCAMMLSVTLCVACVQPSHLSTGLSLTESALNRYNRLSDVWRGGPYPHYESMNGQNR